MAYLHLTLAASDHLQGTHHAGLRPGGAHLGALRVGPVGLARRIATVVGVPWRPATYGQRLAAADAWLQADDNGERWYSGTREVDPFGVARWCLARLDELVWLGWSGAASSGVPRLATLSALATAVPMGTAQCTNEVVARVKGLCVSDVVREVLVERSRAAHQMLTRRLLDALERSGVVVRESESTAVRGTSDLARLQQALQGGTRVELVGDGTVTLIVADTSLEAAESVVAVARGGQRSPAWVVTSDASRLDAAFAAQGLPRAGLVEVAETAPAQVLPLVLELQFAQRDPDVALQLLTSPARPFAGQLAFGLAKAIADRPGFWGPAFREAVDAGLAALAEAGAEPRRVERVRQRLSTWIPEPDTVLDGDMPVARALELAEQVAAWAQARAANAFDDAAVWLDAVARANLVADVLRGRGPRARVSREEMRQLVAAAGVAPQALYVAEAGAPVVARAPEALPSRHDDVIWFGVVGGAAEQSAPAPLSKAELQALDAEGCDVPDSLTRRRSEEAHWSWPVFCARERLKLVTWRNDGGANTVPHPMLDLWLVRLGEASLDAVTQEAVDIRSQGTSLVEVVRPVAPREPSLVWEVDEPVELPDTLSPSAVDQLLTCPLRFTLERVAGVRPSGVGEVKSDALVFGDLAHRLLQDDVLYTTEVAFDALSPETAASRVREAFDRRVPEEAAFLLLPGRGVARQQMCEQIASAAASLVAQLQGAGWRPVEQAEFEMSGTFAGRSTRGRIDVVVEHNDGRRAVIDIKLREGDLTRKLSEGRALQLAMYVQALADGQQRPTSAYFAVKEAAFVTADDRFGASRAPVAGLGDAAALAVAEDAWSWWATLLERGVVAALGKTVGARIEVKDVVESIGDDDLDPDGVPGAYRRPRPSCDYCDQRRICGWSVGGGLTSTDEGGA